jgi:hypothetical protein
MIIKYKEITYLNCCSKLKFDISRMNLEIISLNGIDSDCTICVATESENIIFDVGEGTQRYETL